MRDHPRIRGTNTPAIVDEVSARGSSPHTRDKCNDKSKERHRGGIIPAYAGQIVSNPLNETPVQDHPRIRGTNLAMVGLTIDYVGSSPHTRDKFLVQM